MDYLRVMHPRRGHQRHPFAGRQKLVFLAWRLPLRGVCSVWLLDRLCGKNPIPKSGAVINPDPIRDPLSGNIHVLLVAAWLDPAPLMVHLWHIIHLRDRPERHLTLT